MHLRGVMDILKRIRIEDHKIRGLSLLDGSQIIRLSEEPRPDSGSRSAAPPVDEYFLHLGSSGAVFNDALRFAGGLRGS
jgi:hypothetical protein